jgi:hypothetical protein
MANGAFKFKDNSGNVVSFISGSGSNISFSGGTLDLSGMTGLTLGNLTLSGTTQNALSASHAASYLLTSSFNTYSGTTNTVIGTLQTSTGSLNSFTSSTNGRLNSIEGVSGSYATTGSNQFKSDQSITGSLTVTGFIDAQELRTTYISSSILYRSGSTKFGDELSDTHAFTGSLLVSGTISVPGQNIITRSGGGETTELSFFNGSNTIGGTSALTYAFPKLTLGLSTSDNNEDYNLLIQRHGTSSSPGSASSTPALQVVDYAGDGHSSYQVAGIVDIVAPRISNIDTNAGNTNLLRVANDDGTALHISGKNRVFIGQTSQTDNGQQLQVNGTSRFNGTATFTGQVNVGTDLGLTGSNPRIDYPSGSYFRLYQTDVGTKFYVGTDSNYIFYGTGIDSPKISLQGLNYTNAIIGDTTTGDSDVGNLWLYNNGTLKIRLDSDDAGTTYFNSGKVAIGTSSSTNSKFRVYNNSSDSTYNVIIQGVFGSDGYLDSDAANGFGAGTSETQFLNGSATRPAMLSLGGTLNTDEAVGVINFFRSGNTDGYRARVQLAGVVGSGGTAGQHGGWLSIRTAGNGDTNPTEMARFTQFQNLELKYRETVGARYGFIYSKEALHLSNNSYYSNGWFMATTGPASGIVADNDGSVLIRTAASNTENNSTTWLTKTRTWGTDRTNFTVGTSTALAEAVNRGNITINGASNSILSFGVADSLKGYLYNNGTDFVMNHGGGSFTFETNTATPVVISSSGGVGIRTTPGTLQLNVNGSTNGINLETAVTPSAAVTPYFTILESGVSRTVTGYNYETTQPLAMIITQTANTTLGLSRMSEDTVGSVLRGMKARGTAAAPASVANGDVVFAIEGYAWHGAGPNHPKLGAGMRFVKDDNWGTASTYAPQRTEFYNANSGTSTQTTLIIYPSGNASLTGVLTESASDVRLKTNITKIENALEKINQLEGFTYNWNNISPLYIENPVTKEVGLSAQDVMGVLPEVVSLAPFDIDSSNGQTSKSGQNYLTVKYEKLVPLLIEGIKEQQTIIDNLKIRIEQLENN